MSRDGRWKPFDMQATVQTSWRWQRKLQQALRTVHVDQQLSRNYSDVRITSIQRTAFCVVGWSIVSFPKDCCSTIVKDKSCRQHSHSNWALSVATERRLRRDCDTIQILFLGKISFVRKLITPSPWHYWSPMSPICSGSSPCKRDTGGKMCIACWSEE